MEGLPRGQFASGQLPPLQYQPPPVMRQPMPDQQWLPALQVTCDVGPVLHLCKCAVDERCLCASQLLLLP